MEAQKQTESLNQTFIDAVTVHQFLFGVNDVLPTSDALLKALDEIPLNYETTIELHESIINHLVDSIDRIGATGLILNSLLLRFEKLDSATIKSISPYVNALLDLQSSITDTCFLLHARSRLLRHAEDKASLRQYLSEAMMHDVTNESEPEL